MPKPKKPKYAKSNSAVESLPVMQFRSQLEGMNQMLITLSAEVRNLTGLVEKNYTAFAFHQHNTILGTTPQFFNTQWHQQYLQQKQIEAEKQKPPPPNIPADAKYDKEKPKKTKQS